MSAWNETIQSDAFKALSDTPASAAKGEADPLIKVRDDLENLHRRGGLGYGAQGILERSIIAIDAAITRAQPHPSQQAGTEVREALQDCWGALNFILAFYEPGQRHLDTNAWKNAEASGRRAHAKAAEVLNTSEARG